MTSEIARNAIFTDHSGMAGPKNPDLIDVFPERARFVELLDAKLAEGASYVEIAEALGLKSTRSLEHEWRYDKSRRPGRKTLELAFKYFKIDPWGLGEALGDLDDTPPYTIEEQFDMRALGTNLKRLAPEARARVIKAWRAVLESSVPTNATIQMEVKRRGKG